MLTLLLASLAFAADPIVATTSPGFTWAAVRDATEPVAVATFSQGKIAYELRCNPTECRVLHGTTRLAAHVTVTVVKGTTPTVNVVIDGTDAGYLFQKVAVRWVAPALPKSTVVRLGGNDLE